MYERAYHITMLTVALVLAVMGRGDSYILSEKTRDLKPLQIVLSAESCTAPVHYAFSNAHHEIGAPVAAPEIAAPETWKWLICLQCLALAAPLVCSSSARASPASA